MHKYAGLSSHSTRTIISSHKQEAWHIVDHSAGHLIQCYIYTVSARFRMTKTFDFLIITLK